MDKKRMERCCGCLLILNTMRAKVQLCSRLMYQNPFQMKCTHLPKAGTTFIYQEYTSHSGSIEKLDGSVLLMPRLYNFVNLKLALHQIIMCHVPTMCIVHRMTMVD